MYDNIVQRILHNSAEIAVNIIKEHAWEVLSTKRSSSGLLCNMIYIYAYIFSRNMRRNFSAQTEFAEGISLHKRKQQEEEFAGREAQKKKCARGTKKENIIACVTSSALPHSACTPPAHNKKKLAFMDAL
jgi:adenine-specific DNA glycosylase